MLCETLMIKDLLSLEGENGSTTRCWMQRMLVAVGMEWSEL
jgi:hypothetical protein